MRPYRLIWIIVLILTVFTAAVAQESAPALGTAQENVCNEGGLLFRDGVSLCETEWHWECGWYIAHWQNTAAPVPAWCGTGHLPSASSVPNAVYIGCRAIPIGLYAYFGYHPIVSATATRYTDANCTLSTAVFPGGTMIYASSMMEATSMCLAELGIVINITFDGTYPSIYWCV